MSLYVYYRVPLAQQVAARRAIEAMQMQLMREHPGLRAKLMCRAEETENVVESTWMEVYEHPSGVSVACEHSLKALVQALPPALIGARHTEVFCPLADRLPGTA